MSRNMDSRGARAYRDFHSGNDRRITLRYDLRARADFTWRDENGESQKGRGYSRNISARGAYLIATDCPSPGTAVTLKVYFPPQHECDPALQMKAVGRVLRVEGASGEWNGLAIQSERMSLCTD